MAKLLIIGGMSRVMDAAAVGFILMGAGIVSVIWLILMVRRKLSGREWLRFAVFWALSIGFATFVWVGGRIADDRRYRQDMEQQLDWESKKLTPEQPRPSHESE